MLLAKVVGTLVATRKDPKISGLKFLVLRQVNPETLKEGGYVVANDAVGCGVGEYVLYASGSSARQTEVTKDRPCDAVVMAIVDSWEIGGEPRYEKTGGGYVTAIIRGDVAAVKAAVEAGQNGAARVGEIVATHIIARPHVNVDLVLPLGRKGEVEKELQSRGGK